MADEAVVDALDDILHPQGISRSAWVRQQAIDYIAAHSADASSLAQEELIAS